MLYSEIIAVCPNETAVCVGRTQNCYMETWLYVK